MDKSTFVISLDIYHGAFSLDQLSSILGEPPGPGSHSLGVPSVTGSRVWRETRWRVEDVTSDKHRIGESLEAMVLKGKHLRTLASKRRVRVDLVINIAAFFTTAACSLKVPHSAVLAIGRARMALLVDCYPCSEPPQRKLSLGRKKNYAPNKQPRSRRPKES